MTNDNKPEGSKKRDLRSIERVESLYKLADELYGGFAEPAPPSISKPVVTNSRTEAGDHAQANAITSGDVAQVPLWILGVLEDLSSFAENNNYSDLENCLTDAHRRAAKIIRDMKKS